MEPISVLILERDRMRACRLAEALHGNDFRIRIASSGEQALLLFGEDPPDLVVTESMAADTDGRRLLDELGEGFSLVLVRNAVTLGDVMEAAARRLRRMNGHAVDIGPDGHLVAWPKQECGTASVPEIVGKSACMETIRRQILNAAGSDLPVLLTGETGTGKDLVARAIHRLSDRRKKSFIKHNCATSLPQLLEGQFFGSCEGSFTGAIQDRRGLLELAHGGVLFLDELEALDPGLQAKLLCAIEDQEIWPVGASEPRKVSVRFLAATNRDPRRMMAQGTLREDLYYRLRGIEIHLRPIRDHREDIPLLVARFLGPQASMLAPEALERLMAEEWPGNVRQIQHVILAARDSVLTSGEDRITAGHLDLTPPAFESSGASDDQVTRPGRTLDEIVRDAILRAVREARGNHSAAARMLRISRATIREKLREARLSN